MFRKFIKSWIEQEDGLAAIEAAMIFPILMVMLLGTLDVGYGILASQKTIRASQVTADLIARHRMVNSGDINNAVDAGELSLVPFTTESYGVDIVSIRFDDNNNPVVLWRETRNMSPNPTVLSSLDGLGRPGEGLVAVTVEYDYEPNFSGFVVDRLTFQEISYVRGRLSPSIPMQGG